MTVVGILVFILVVCIVVWATNQLLSAFSVGNPLAGVIHIVVVLLLLVAFLEYVGVLKLGLKLY